MFADYTALSYRDSQGRSVERLDVLVQLLLCLALVLTEVAWNKWRISKGKRDELREALRTMNFLRAVAGDGTDNGVLLAADAVDSAVCVALDLDGLVLGLALDVLLLSGVGPRRRAGQVADGLDDVALDGVVLASGLARRGGHHVNTCPGEGTERATYLGSPVMMMVEKWWGVRVVGWVVEVVKALMKKDSSHDAPYIRGRAGTSRPRRT